MDHKTLQNNEILLKLHALLLRASENAYTKHFKYKFSSKMKLNSNAGGRDWTAFKYANKLNSNLNCNKHSFGKL